MKAPLAPIRVYQYTKDPITDEYIVPLTKREQFAMAAMQGWLSHCNDIPLKRVQPESVAKAAVEFADALIEELDKC